jgi:hypothetical protein
MQGTLKGMHICHRDSVDIEHHRRVAGGLVGSLSENCNYSVRLRVSGVIRAQYTKGGLFLSGVPQRKSPPQALSLRHDLLDHARSSTTNRPRLCKMVYGADHSTPCVML